MKAKQEDIKKLSSYTKQEIIQAIESLWQGDVFVHDLLDFLEDKKTDTLLKQHTDAIDNLSAARKAYIDWKHDIIKKYGDGLSVKCRDIPDAELERGVTLEKAIKDATERERKLNNKVKRILDL